MGGNPFSSFWVIRLWKIYFFQLKEIFGLFLHQSFYLWGLPLDSKQWFATLASPWNSLEGLLKIWIGYRSPKILEKLAWVQSGPWDHFKAPRWLWHPGSVELCCTRTQPPWQATSEKDAAVWRFQKGEPVLTQSSLLPVKKKLVIRCETYSSEEDVKEWKKAFLFPHSITNDHGHGTPLPVGRGETGSSLKLAVRNPPSSFRQGISLWACGHR